MGEREPPPYWQEDVAIGESRFYRGETSTIRMRLHTATERYHRSQEIIPLTETRGEWVYVHGKPYILVPDITLSIGLYHQPDSTGAIGEVTSSEWGGMRHEDIGTCQGWFYPADRLIMLWEAYVEDRFRRADPREDPALLAVWQGFERLLVARFPTARQLVTPYEDLYPRPMWQAFVARQGYQPLTPATFVKPIPQGHARPVV